jgi:hypothetical protein
MTQADCLAGTNITNYQKLDHFDLSRFGGVILDESSILKSTDGHYRTRLIEACAGDPVPPRRHGHAGTERFYGAWQPR